MVIHSRWNGRVLTKWRDIAARNGAMPNEDRTKYITKWFNMICPYTFRSYICSYFCNGEEWLSKKFNPSIPLTAEISHCPSRTQHTIQRHRDIKHWEFNTFFNWCRKKWTNPMIWIFLLPLMAAINGIAIVTTYQYYQNTIYPYGRICF